MGTAQTSLYALLLVPAAFMCLFIQAWMKTSAAAHEPCKATLRTMSHPVVSQRRLDSTRFPSLPLFSIDPQSHKNDI